MDPELLEMVPQPLVAVLLLFPISEAHEAHSAEQKVSKHCRRIASARARSHRTDNAPHRTDHDSLPATSASVQLCSALPCVFVFASSCTLLASELHVRSSLANDHINCAACVEAVLRTGSDLTYADCISQAN